MSTSDHMTLAQFDALTLAEAKTLPVDQIVLLLEEVARTEALIEVTRVKLHTTLMRRYGAVASKLRKSAGDAAGPAFLVDGNFTIRVDSAKSVAWDQAKLSKLAETIFHDWQLDPEDYITITYAVEEEKYCAWPPDLRKHFDDARTLGAGTLSFDIVSPKKGAARAGPRQGRSVRPCAVSLSRRVGRGE